MLSTYKNNVNGVQSGQEDDSPKMAIAGDQMSCWGRVRNPGEVDLEERYLNTVPGQGTWQGGKWEDGMGPGLGPGLDPRGKGVGVCVG